MVLERPIFRSWGARLWAILAMAILWGGCLKASPTQRLQNETPISVALVHDLGNTVVPVPSELEMKIRKALVARNLAVHTIDQESFETDFARKRASRDRYQSMTSLSQGAQLSLLLETRAQYFSQLNGRFRWTVYVKLSIGKAGEAGPASTTNFTVPVMLMYDHQRESDALTYAASTIASKTGKEIDDFVAGLDLATQSVTSAAR